MKRQYSWKPDLPNPQDFKFKLSNVSPSLETTSNRTKYKMMRPDNSIKQNLRPKCKNTQAVRINRFV